MNTFLLKDDSNKPYSWCSKCPNYYSRTYNVQQHIEANHMIIQIPCKFCELNFKTRHGIKRHLRLYHPLPTHINDMADCMTNMTFKKKE